MATAIRHLRDLNPFNKALLACAVLMAVYTLLQVWGYAPHSREHYALVACEPRSFPVYANVRLAHGHEVVAELDSRMPNTWLETWGEPLPSADGDFRRLPTRIEVEFVALQEHSYHAGQFALPVERLTRIFEDARRNDAMLDIHSGEGLQKKPARGLIFAACIANHGGLRVSVRGKGFEEELLKLRVAARTPDEGALDFGRPMSLDAFIEQHFVGLGDAAYQRALARYDPAVDWLDMPSGWQQHAPVPDRRSSR